MSEEAARWIVAIPAKNEEERLEGALAAVDEASARLTTPVCALVLANDCHDRTEAVASAFARQSRIPVLVRSVELPPTLAHAGGARATAVRAAFTAFRARADDWLLTTDADCRLEIEALMEMEAGFGRGADLVLARIECLPDPFDPVPEEAVHWGTPHVTWRGKVRQLVETIRRGRVPDPPLHDDYGGAGIAIKVSAYRALGGFAAVPTNEDFALVNAADRAGMTVNRQTGAIVHAMTRARGRATGGMADALAANLRVSRTGGTRLVERHQSTAARIAANPSHATAFRCDPDEVEPVDTAITGLDQIISRYETRL